MAWYFNSIRVFAQELTEDTKQIIARLQPLNTTTVHQVFGYEGDVYKLNCKVVGNTDKNALKALARTGLTYELNNGTDLGDYYLSNISVQLGTSIYQTLRLDLACESPVYNCVLELYKT